MLNDELQPYGYAARYRFGGNYYAVPLDQLKEHPDINKEVLLGNASRLEAMTAIKRKRLYDLKLNGMACRTDVK